MTQNPPPETIRHLHIDFETASAADLRKTGAYKYSLDPTTTVICMAYAFSDNPGVVYCWDSTSGDPFPEDVIDHVSLCREVHGWNVSFEHAIWNNALRRQIIATVPGTRFLPELSRVQLRDTMAAAAYWGLPLSLDQAATALNSSHQKDKGGHALMMRMNRPRGFDDYGAPRWWHEEDQTKLALLKDYCVQDVRTEMAVGRAIRPLPEPEQKVWQADFQMNYGTLGGVGIDLSLVQALRKMVSDEVSRLNAEMHTLTEGKVSTITATKSLLEFLQIECLSPITDLTKDTVAARLAEMPTPAGHTPTMLALERQLLTLRAEGAKTSTAKLEAMLNAQVGGTIYGMLQHYGASRTGRWAGRLVQMQNLPRATIPNPELAVKIILDAWSRGEPIPVDTLRVMFGPIMDVVASCLRSCIVPPLAAWQSAPHVSSQTNSQIMFSGDFSQIEARVVACLAGQQDILDVFASGMDVYRYTAGNVTGTDWKAIPKDSPLRQLGKVLVLACGFGMSYLKFRETARLSGVNLTVAEAEQAVKAWRQANHHIVKFWWDCEGAAKKVIQAWADGNAAGRIAHVRGLTFAMTSDGHLAIQLPSKRVLFYRDARLRSNPASFSGEEITFMGTSQTTRQWGQQVTYGGKLVENITQAVARDVMADALLAIAADPDLIPILLVHDEAVTYWEPRLAPGADLASETKTRGDRLKGIMSTPPKWLPNLPVAAEVWSGPRYKK